MNKTDKDIEKLLIDDDRISMYLQGKMNADEETSFMEELKTNEDLRQRAIAQARLIKGMKQADAELVDAIKRTDRQTIINIATNKPANAAFNSGGIKGFTNLSEELFGDEKNEESSNKVISIRWLAYAASIILIVFVGFKGYDYYHTVNLGKQYADTFVLSDIVRGEANADIEAELKTLFDNVANGENLSKTTERLDAIWQIAKQDTYSDYTDYAAYIGWYLAIGYLRDYEKAKAETVLSEMANIYPNNSIFGEIVNELLNNLNVF